MLPLSSKVRVRSQARFVGFAVDKLALKHVCLRVPWLSPLSTIPPLLLIHRHNFNRQGHQVSISLSLTTIVYCPLSSFITTPTTKLILKCKQYCYRKTVKISNTSLYLTGLQSSPKALWTPQIQNIVVNSYIHTSLIRTTKAHLHAISYCLQTNNSSPLGSEYDISAREKRNESGRQLQKLKHFNSRFLGQIYGKERQRDSLGPKSRFVSLNSSCS